ncbi:MAG: M20 family metallo-hydrolase [Bacteroidota bacterium]
MTTQKDLAQEAIVLLQGLIEIPSFSREEKDTCAHIAAFLSNKSIKVHVDGYNIWCFQAGYDPAKPHVLLNSHHDTVKPNKGYSRDPFSSDIDEEGKLYGLGSNDAGGPLVSLLMTFLHFYEQELPFNLVFAATAEEEISGKGGIASILSKLPAIDLGIVGEPTGMQMAVAEKGLIVIDCLSKGKAGHAARKNGLNAIELSLKDLQWLKDYEFERVSNSLGKINMSVTQINAGTQHNVIPDRCEFVLDVRTTDAYTNEEVVRIIEDGIDAEVKPRSTRLQPSGVPDDHPIVNVAKKLGITRYGSPTLSDQALMPFSTIKMGPGLSERSHTADEFIYVHEIADGIAGYIRLIENLKL